MEHYSSMLSFAFLEKLNIEDANHGYTFSRLIYCFSISNRQRPAFARDNNAKEIV